MIHLAALAALLAGSPQEPPPASIEERLAALIARHYPEVDESRRSALAGRMAEGIRRSGSFGHDPAAVLGSVERRLSSGIGLVDEMQQVTHVLSKGYTEWIPDADRRLALPDSFRAREREGNLAVVESYVDEMAARRAATEEERRAIAAQVEAAAREVAAAARSKIYGAYRDALVEKLVGWAAQDLLGRALGDPLQGGLVRPLTEGEFREVLAAAREAAERAEPVEASSPADLRMAQTAELEADQETPAIRLASELAFTLYRFGEIQYPRTLGAVRRRDQVLSEAAAWVREALEPIHREAEARGARSIPADRIPKALAATLPAGAKRPPPRAAPASEPAPAPRPARQESRPAVLRWTVAAALFGVGLAVWALARSRRRAPLL